MYALFLVLIFCLSNSVASYEVSLFQRGFQKGTLQWEVAYATETVEFSLRIPYTILLPNQAFGLGFSDRGEIYNADIARISYARKQIVIEDCWTDNDGFLYRDRKQDYKLLHSDAGVGEMIVTFERLFYTNDIHDYDLDNGTTNIITLLDLPRGDVLVDESSATVSRINLIDYPKYLARVQLLKPEYTVHVDDDVMSFDVVAINVTIPASETTYWCTVQRLPNFTNKVHGIGFGPVISRESRSLVHHIEVFGCDVRDGEIPQFSGNCNSPNHPIQLDRCRHVLGAWAYGAETLFYPEEAGLTFYSSKKSQYVRLEIHYNNQNHYADIIDRSGIRFYYSRRLREHEIGILETGVIYTPEMAIPPGREKFAWTGICPAACTLKAFPRSGIKVFASELHTHLAGREVWTSHSRGNTQLPELIRDVRYSTWFEEIRRISPARTVLPGDELATTCVFSSKRRRNVILGGLGIHEEMCVNYLHYYPATELEVCKTSVSKLSLMVYFTLQNIETGIKSGIVNEYNKVKWNQKSVDMLKSIYEHSAMKIECLKPNGDKWV